MKRTRPKPPKVRPAIGYAAVGSHGGIFEFVSGPVGDRYPHLLEIYRYKSPGLVRVQIVKTPARKGR